MDGNTRAKREHSYSATLTRARCFRQSKKLKHINLQITDADHKVTMMSQWCIRKHAMLKTGAQSRMNYFS